MTEDAVPQRRYTPSQLARLMEILGSVKCECPSHLSKLVEALVTFEEYSRGCENANEADREVHRMLARETGKARGIMEGALEELLRFEKIEV